jgi:glutamate-1-semialdehyde aminotransferase
MLIGHAHPEVIAAVQDQLPCGTNNLSVVLTHA